MASEFSTIDDLIEVLLGEPELGLYIDYIGYDFTHRITYEIIFKLVYDNFQTFRLELYWRSNGSITWRAHSPDISERELNIHELVREISKISKIMKELARLREKFHSDKKEWESVPYIDPYRYSPKVEDHFTER
jgi:hypothetical protein